LIWFDLSVYYDLSSVQIHKALDKFLKSHWLHYNIDYVDKDAFLNNEQNGDSLITCFKQIHSSNSPFWIKFILQNVLNWFLCCEIQFFGIHFEIACKRFDRRLRPTLYLLVLTNISITFLWSDNVFNHISGVSRAWACSVMVS